MKTKARYASVLFIVAALMSVLGCGGVRIRNVQPITDERADMLALTEVDPNKVPEYLIGPGDELQVKVTAHPELSGNLTVGSFGEIRLPESGDVVQAADRTVAELEETIIWKYSAFTKAEPVVIVSIAKFNSKFVYVLGAVRNPGKYSVGDRVLSLRDAVYRAGMPQADAALRKVIVVKPDRDKPQALKIDFEEIMYGNRLRNNIALSEGDVVFLPFTSFSKTMNTLDRIGTPLVKAATALAAGVYIYDELKSDE